MVAVELTLLSVSIAYAFYLRTVRRDGGDYGQRAPIYTAIGVGFTGLAHLAVMLILWPLAPGEVSALLLVQFVISGLPAFVMREIEQRENRLAARRDEETETARLRAKLDALKAACDD